MNGLILAFIFILAYFCGFGGQLLGLGRKSGLKRKYGRFSGWKAGNLDEASGKLDASGRPEKIFGAV